MRQIQNQAASKRPFDLNENDHWYIICKHHTTLGSQSMWNDFQKFTNELIQKNYKFYINNATDFVLCLNDTTTKKHEK